MGDECVPMPDWMVELRAEVEHVWALELNELDPEIREAVIAHQVEVECG